VENVAGIAATAMQGDGPFAEKQFQHCMRSMTAWEMPVLAFGAGVAMLGAAGATFPSSPDLGMLGVLQQASAAAMALAFVRTPWLPLVTDWRSACREALHLITN
jgi:succinyl-CoA synthetase alpha subunit